MEKYVEGLLLHDIILIVLGTLMFLVLLVGLIIHINRRESFSQFYLIGFVISAVMIAYPSIQKVAFSKNVIELEKIADKVVDNPQDTFAKVDLQKKLNQLEDRPVTSPKNMNTVSRSHYLLGNKDQAKAIADSVLVREPQSTDAKEIKTIIELDEEIEKIEANPQDQVAAEKAKQKLQTLKGLPDSKLKENVIRRVEPLLPPPSIPTEREEEEGESQ